MPKNAKPTPQNENNDKIIKMISYRKVLAEYRDKMKIFRSTIYN